MGSAERRDAIYTKSSYQNNFHRQNKPIIPLCISAERNAMNLCSSTAINDLKLINQKWISRYVRLAWQRNVMKRARTHGSAISIIIAMLHVSNIAAWSRKIILPVTFYSYRLQVFTCRKLGNKYMEVSYVCTYVERDLILSTRDLTWERIDHNRVHCVQIEREFGDLSIRQLREKCIVLRITLSKIYKVLVFK